MTLSKSWSSVWVSDDTRHEHKELVMFDPEDENDETPDCYDEPDDGMTDVEADADALASAGWGTDEDYGYYGDDTD